MTVIKRFAKKYTKVTIPMLFVVYIYLYEYIGNLRIAVNSGTKPPDLVSPSGLISTSKYEMKYLLLWTKQDTTPFIYFGTGNKVFLEKKCKWTNCYVTDDRKFLGDYTEFDVIAFHGPQLLPLLVFGDIPLKRDARQKYVFANIESSANYPLCSNVWNGFFNWTWTYKLNSDGVWGYVAVRNASKHVVGPSIHMHWLRPELMGDIDHELKVKLKTKDRLAAWFASNCMTQSLRETYVQDLQRHLEKFNLNINIYGKCGQFGCPKEIMPRCLKTLEKRYFFYLAFENALSDDYVTERIVYALQHNTVPIVFGGANYSRFLPEGSYINAVNIKPEKLAAKMYQIMKNRTLYYSYFRWKKYYSYHLRNESPETDDYCQFCAMMNDEQLMRRSTTYEHLNKWWTGRYVDKICHPTSNFDPAAVNHEPKAINQEY